MSNSEELKVRILTLNCWGLKYASRKREQRMDAICEKLRNAASLYDIVALQEVWVEEDYQKLKDSVQGYLHFAKRWYSGILTGPGLVVFSRWPIESSWIYRFPINGRPSAVWRGDWFVGKSAGSCVILHPSGRKVEVINAHLHAPYSLSGDNNYTCHRASQAWDLSGIVHRACLSGHTVFLTGDLNYLPDSVGMALLETRAQLCDAWSMSHEEPLVKNDGFGESSSNEDESKPVTKRHISSMTPLEQIELVGTTCDSQANSWRASWRIDEAKRLDYIFYDSRKASIVNSKVVFTEIIPGVGSMSDHFGVCATFVLSPESRGTIALSYNPINRTDTGVLNVKKRKVLQELLVIIDDYKPVSERQAWWRLLHFGLSNLVLVGILVSVWWGAAHNRAYVGFVYILVSFVVTVTGYIDGLIGFLFGRNEKRALIEFENQVNLEYEQLN